MATNSTEVALGRRAVPETWHGPHGVCATSDESFSSSAFSRFHLRVYVSTPLRVFVFVFAVHFSCFCQVQVLNFDAVISELMKSVLAENAAEKLSDCQSNFKRSAVETYIFATYSYSYSYTPFVFVFAFIHIHCSICKLNSKHI